MALSLQHFLSVIGDAVVIADANGIITTWNCAAEAMFGYAQSEALGASLDIIIPEKYRMRHAAGFEQTMNTGKNRYGTSLLHVPAMKRDGSSISIAFSIALVLGEAGKPESIIAIIRDETQRFQEERALRKRLAELGNGE
ncbi:PAS domain-containing protein [Mangrovibacter yixingensis]|uniref:PAS domain-containing protein n=1 Tax=Mangrovibacter yixingensis TaxID=1529639 RepID=UPI001CFCD360|nr:PAS domain-containing protein [Mangrovibacter yixingensis]